MRNGSMLRGDFQVLTRTRLREAKVLSRAGLYDGAYYLGGLAIETALKSCTARATRRYEFPDRNRVNRAYTHDLDELLRLAGLESTLKSSPPVVRASWATVRSWTIETRYYSGRLKADVHNFLDAAAGRDGVLRWLKQFW